MLADIKGPHQEFLGALQQPSHSTAGSDATTRDFSRFDEVGMVLKIDDFFQAFEIDSK